MTIHVRAKEDLPALGIRAGEDAAVSGKDAKILQALGKAWVVGGDSPDFADHDIVADTEVGEPIVYPNRGMQAEIIRAPQEV